MQGREKYMIPYNGEEVKLIWANMDQYYIKSSELLRDYTFHIRKDDLGTSELNLGDCQTKSPSSSSSFEGDTEKDNRKPDGKTTRAFTLDAEQPLGRRRNTISGSASATANMLVNAISAGQAQRRHGKDPRR